MVKDSSIDAGATSSGGVDEISINLPKKSAHEIYLFIVSNALNSYKQIIFTMSGVTDPRIIPATRQCIIQIIDDDIRNKLLAALTRGIEYVESRTDLDPGQKGNLMIEVCQNAVAQVYSYLDEFIGLAKVNAVVPVSSVPTKEEEEAAREILDSEGEIPDDIPDQDKAINGGVGKVDAVEDMGICGEK